MRNEHDLSVFAVADDLSGAAETAVALSVRGTRSLVLTAADPGRMRAWTAPVLVVDTDTRYRPPADAARAVTTALAQVRPGDLVFKKIDSLLRGNLAAEIGALAGNGYGVALTPALPVAGRAVRSGVLHLGDGTPLHASGAWRAERADPPKSVAAALAPARPDTLGLGVVRASRQALAEAFTEAAATGRIVVCDAETDTDLDAIALAAAQAPPGLALAGSGGLAAAVGRSLAGATQQAVTPPGPGGQPLIVVGTAEPIAAEQVARLTGCAVHSLNPDDLAAGPVPIPPLSGPTVLRIDPAARLDPGRGPAVSAGLARTVAAALAPRRRPVDLVLIGGETARRVLDVLGVHTLEPLGQIHHGAVRSRTPEGNTVVTRPGSFGGPDSLVQIVRALSAPETDRTAEPAGLSERPSL